MNSLFANHRYNVIHSISHMWTAEQNFNIKYKQHLTPAISKPHQLLLFSMTVTV